MRWPLCFGEFLSSEQVGESERDTNCCEGRRKEVGSATRCRSKEITSWEKTTPLPPLSVLSEKWIFIFRDYGQLPSLILQHINKWRKNRSVRVRGDFSWSKYPLRSGRGALDRSSCGLPSASRCPGSSAASSPLVSEESWGSIVDRPLARRSPHWRNIFTRVKKSGSAGGWGRVAVQCILAIPSFHSVFPLAHAFSSRCEFLHFYNSFRSHF